MNQVKTEKTLFLRWCPGTAPCTLYNYFMTLSESSPPSVQRSRNTSFAFELIVIPLFKVRLIDETKDNISIYTAFCHVLLFQLNLSKGSLVLISVNSHLVIHKLRVKAFSSPENHVQVPNKWFSMLVTNVIPLIWATSGLWKWCSTFANGTRSLISQKKGWGGSPFPHFHKIRPSTP